MGYEFFRFTSVYVACECRCISGRPFSPPGSKKSDDRKYICVDRLRCKNQGTFSLPRTFCCCCFFFGSTVLTSLFSLFYVTCQYFTGSYTEGEPVFFRSFGLLHLQVQKGRETII